jgi:hypothetical protein
MTHALDFASVCETHAVAAFDLMDSDQGLKNARRLWTWIERQRKPEFSFRNAFNALRTRNQRVADFAPAIAVLVERYHIALQSNKNKALIYEVNPVLCADWSRESARLARKTRAIAVATRD